MKSKNILFISIILCFVGLTSIVYADSLAQRLAGRILLQVESKGEAWYINPVNKQRYYLNSPEQCFQVLRKLGLGISDKNIVQIPIAKDSSSVPAAKNSANNPSPTAQTTESKIINKKIGDIVELSTVRFKVNSMEEKYAVSGIFGIKTSKQDAKFIIINLDITNIINSDVNYFSPDLSEVWNPEGFILVDQKSRQFTTYNNTIGYIDNHLIGRKLAPSITENGVLVYEIPIDSVGYGITTINNKTKDIYLVQHL